MRRLIYSMGVSLDGFIAGPDGDFGWTMPDDELHLFHNQRVRELGAHLLGRRLYETMIYWETVLQDPSSAEIEREFAEIWLALPKIVFSNTLTEVAGTNTTLARDDVAAVVAALKAEPGKDIAIGGAGLAATCVELDLIDEYHVFVYPVLVGGGTRFFPARAGRLDLELIETRTFASRVVSSRYRRA